ncbi:related to peroxisome assembly protein car1 [Melanopsichium pennsylvanicum]|uniref:RING-type E3 ubiquitin transferase (cysteine targeting) n=2 Tax=Melanopsichium pennsylvanicum TaxID=63383 RepID=A0AAJ4XI77_9BASI|nr:related to peroxisome assembly protein car1 [Melanopsichium pennsylvanicum 4]SNX81638.1 related to peroxisome assembly protein car1 [Melanopsichium pennsylvanicum]
MADDSGSSTAPVAGPSYEPTNPQSLQQTSGMPTPETLASDPSAVDAQVGQPPPFYHAASSAAALSIASIRSSLYKFPTPILKIQRVNQLDAELLDRELAELLLDPVKKALGSIRSTLASDLEPELLLLLKLALFKFSIVDRGASYGSMLQNLKYRNEWAHRGALQSTARDQPLSRLQLTLYPLLTIVAPYLGSKWQHHMTSLSYSDMPNNDPRRLLWKLTDASQRVWSALVLANFSVFLADGKFRSVADRVLGMRLTYAKRTMNRNVSFEFLNRQLVWHAFTEFLLFLLPLVRPKRLFRRLVKLPTHPKLLALVYKFLPIAISRRLGMNQDAMGRTRFNRSDVSMPVVKQIVGNGPKSSGNKDEKSSLKDIMRNERQGPYHHLPEDVCAICYQRLEKANGLQRDVSKLGTGGLSMGIPTSDPLDPSSGLLAPNRRSSTSQPLNAKNGSGRGASGNDQARNEVLGVSPDGIAYADAIVTTAYETVPCGHTYCYVCIANQLLDEEMEDELDEQDEDGHRGWKCLRCNTRVRETRRVIGESAVGGGSSLGDGDEQHDVSDDEELEEEAE